MNTLYKGAEVFLPDGTVQQADIAVTGDLIVEVGKVRADWRADEVVDMRGKFAVPGFVNAHTHASMTLLRSYADDMNLMDWLQKKIWPVEAKMTADDIYWGAMLAAVEMIKSGTTAFADMYGPNMECVAEVVKESGMRASLCRGLIGLSPARYEALQTNIDLYDQYHGKAEGRITVMFGPHAPYTCSPEYLRDVVQEAAKRKAEIHIHLAETKGEVEGCIAEYGCTPFKHMEKLGVLQQGVLAAHCVHLTDEDIALMKKYNVRAAHNPGSNMKLASGISPVPKLLEAGICTALGTDGASSNNNLDMLEEARLAALLHKTDTYDPAAVPAAAALKMATENGAEALGLKKVGRLAKGYKADITFFDTNSAAWCPKHNLVSLLIYSASSADVDTVVVNGKTLMKNRELLTLDEERIMYEAGRCAANLVK